MEMISISKEEYLNLMKVVQNTSFLTMEVDKINKGADLNLSIKVCDTLRSIQTWVASNHNVPPTVNVFNGNN